MFVYTLCSLVWEICNRKRKNMVFSFGGKQLMIGPKGGERDRTRPQVTPYPIDITSFIGIQTWNSGVGRFFFFVCAYLHGIVLTLYRHIPYTPLYKLCVCVYVNRMYHKLFCLFTFFFHFYFKSSKNYRLTAKLFTHLKEWSVL